MEPLLGFVIVSSIFAIGDIVSIKSKSLLSVLFVASVFYLIGFWTIFPADINTIAQVQGVGAMMIPVLITHMGTLLNTRQLIDQWKTVIITIVALVGAISGSLMVNHNINIWLSMVICLIVGILIGCWQGFWIAYIRIPAFIVTLAGMLVWRGLALIVLDGLTINPFPANFQSIFNSYIPDVFDGPINIVAILIGLISCIVYIALQVVRWRNNKGKEYQLESLPLLLGKTTAICLVIILLAYILARHEGLPSILILLVLVILFYSYLTNKTVAGRYLYAMGGNEKAAKLSGINTNKVLFFSYVNVAFLSALAALVCVARFNSAAPTAGQSYELDAIGSCFIGGASAYGGTGKVSGVVIGAFHGCS